MQTINPNRKAYENRMSIALLNAAPRSSSRSEKRRRKLIGFGSLYPQSCLKPRFDNPLYDRVYSALKQSGYSTTLWQYIFDGQIASLVRRGKNDVHIRFYRDRIFVEIEISRALISHFYGPRFNAREIILRTLQEKLSQRDFGKLKHILYSRSLREDERLLPIWEAERGDGTVNGPFEQICSMETECMRDVVKRAFVGIEWRILGLSSIMLVLGVLGLAPSQSEFLEPGLVLAVACGALVVALAPRFSRDR